MLLLLIMYNIVIYDLIIDLDVIIIIIFYTFYTILNNNNKMLLISVQ